MTASAEIQDATIRHQIRMTRVSNSIAGRMLSLLNKSEKRLVRRLQRLDPNDVAERFKVARIEKLLADIRDIQDAARRQLRGMMADTAEEVAAAELEFTRRVVTASAAASVVEDFDFVSPARVRAAAMARPFQGPHLRWATQGEHVDAFFRRRIDLVAGEIARSFAEGETTPNIIRRIRGTRRLNFRDGILETSRHSANTMVRTATTHFANSARQVVYEENDDIIKGVRYIAILDSRTTMICAGLDGRIFPVNSGPRPPQHPNCRSSTAPVLKGEAVPEYKSYGEWLKTQSKDFQEEALGKTRARLFRQGKLPIDRFTDDRSKVLDLKELERIETGAFERAGLID